jgi:hypothetical protein
VSGLRDHAFGCQCRHHVDRPWNRSEHWSPAEVEYLERRFGVASDEALARKLGRSVVGIRVKAKRLGLRKRDAGLSSRGVAAIFGVDPTTVADKWISGGHLRSRRAPWKQGPAPVWLTRLADVEAFIREHPELVDVDKMPESPYRDLAARDPWIGTPEAHRLTGRDSHAIAKLIQAGVIRGRRRGTHWYMPAADVHLIPPLRSADAIEESYFRRQSVLDMRRRRRKGLLARAADRGSAVPALLAAAS